MLDDLTTELIIQGGSNEIYKDPLLTSEMANQPISKAHLEQIKSLLNKTLNDDKLLLNWFAQFMTQPKYPELVDETGERRAASIKINKNMSLKYHNGELV
jgi:50S ribosomal protein L16 3-hydroxylase